eukprot:TRINITY_DN14828_c0_g1_i18.p1 TRINITY_DN14828_c0_g1~~TRINITY_DN14828_c0_g1_i18.p1  ORF type:complete len:110 (+),score=21.22 TRINITY_DN14828_c0_g1_i18:186-515(+)
MARELIVGVYEDYRRFCGQAGKEAPKLEIKMSEHVYGGKKRNYSKSFVSHSPEYYALQTPAPATAPQAYYYESPSDPRAAGSFYPKSGYPYYSSGTPQRRAYAKGYRKE